MTADEKTFRAALRRLPTGVTVVTVRVRDEIHGMTANTVTGLSMDPLLLLVCVDRSARTHDMVRRSERFVVNVLCADQDGVSKAFAERADDDRWAMVMTHRGPSGIPRIDGCAAWFECAVTDALAGGDHTIFVAEVTDVEFGRLCPPLVRYEGAYTTVTR